MKSYNPKKIILIGTMIALVIAATVLVTGTVRIQGSRGSSFDGQVNITGNLQVKGGSPWVDVKAFGAKGDGVTDDTAAVQNAIVAASDGILFIPEGVFLIRAQINFSTSESNIIIKGTGIKSIIKLKSSSNSVIFKINGADRLTFESFAIDGNKNGQTSNGHGFSTAANSDYINFNKLYIYDTKSEAILVSQSQYTTIENCYFKNISGDGVELDRTNWFYVKGNTFYNTVGGKPIYIIDSTNDKQGVIENNIIRYTMKDQSSAIHVAGGKSVIINANLMEYFNITANGVNGIFSTAKNPVITNNLIYNVTGSGIEFHSHGGVIANNKIIGNKMSRATSQGIGVNGVEFTSITGNQIISMPNNGLKLNSADSNVYGVVISNNVIMNNNFSAIRISKTAGNIIKNVIISDNILADNQSSNKQNFAIYEDGAGTSSEISIFNNVIDGNANGTTFGITSGNIGVLANLNVTGYIQTKNTETAHSCSRGAIVLNASNNKICGCTATNTWKCATLS